MDVDELRALLDEYDSIVQQTLRFNRHAVCADDLLGDIWLVWYELSEGRSSAAVPTDPEDRVRLIDAWRRRTEARGRLERTQRGGALSLDHPAGADTAAPALMDRLAAGAESDPLVGLAVLEEALDEAVARLMSRRSLERTWSQPAGYLLLLDARGGSVRALSAAFGVTEASLFTRLRRLMDTHRAQSRLFDARCRLRPIDVRAFQAPSKPPAVIAGPSPQPGLWTGTCVARRDRPTRHGHDPGIEPGPAD